MCFIKIANFEPFECYNCAGNETTDGIQCQNLFFKRADKYEIEKLVTNCPGDNSMCVKLIQKKGNYYSVYRSCQSKYYKDVNLRPGCMFYYANDTENQVCFCAEPKCNSSMKLIQIRILYIFLLFQLIK